jgi:N utilization substance protein B
MKVSRNRARRYARERSLQALYQWDVGGSDASDVYQQFLERQDMSRVDVDYFTLLFNGVSHDVDSVDAVLAPALDRLLGDLDPIERGILRLTTYELQHCPDTPVRVVINEGVEITKRYGADKGHKYVNGVLDKLAAILRPAEMQGRAR